METYSNLGLSVNIYIATYITQFNIYMTVYCIRTIEVGVNNNQPQTEVN